VQEYLRLLLRHSGRPRMRRSLSTSTATTAPPQRGHAPGALCVPTTHSFSAPHSAFTARNAAIFFPSLALLAPASSHSHPRPQNGVLFWGRKTTTGLSGGGGGGGGGLTAQPLLRIYIAERTRRRRRKAKASACSLLSAAAAAAWFCCTGGGAGLGLVLGAGWHGVRRGREERRQRHRHSPRAARAVVGGGRPIPIRRPPCCCSSALGVLRRFTKHGGSSRAVRIKITPGAHSL
jgi:hypothetical protein